MSEPNPLVSTAVSNAIAADDELSAASRLLAAKALERAMYFLTYGSPVMQMNIIRSLMPAVGKAMATRGDEDEELAAMRDQLSELHQRLLLEG